MLPRLEDALRCASLPDDGARLLLIRRLDLGVLPRDASPQTLSLLIERRVAELGGTWVAGGSSAAASANFVVFASRHAARLELARRLVRGTPTEEWYWHPAVPEFLPQATPAANLARMAQALAELPEARVALPAWADALVQAGAAAALTAAVPAAVGEELVRGIGLAVPTPELAAARIPNTAADILPHATLLPLPHALLPYAALPAWLRCLVTAARGHAPVAVPAGIPPQSGTDAAVSTQAVEHIPADAAGTEASSPADAKSSIPARPVPAASVGDPGLPGQFPPIETAVGAPPSPALATPRPVPGEQRPDPTRQRAPVGNPAAQSLAPVPSDASSCIELAAPPWLAPTMAGGLLFLLPLLARLGIAEWSEALGEADDGLARRILAQAARRLRIPGDDPMLLPPPHGNPRSKPPPAPAVWAEASLAPPRSRKGEGDLAARLARSRSLDAQAAIWLTAVRRWLRRRGGIGLASLVLRPAQVAVGATHIDVYFHLDQVDLRVRRCGLDLDPGWLPWLGRVVTFHYERQP